jgi:type 1 glutamine amidotransferase
LRRRLLPCDASRVRCPCRVVLFFVSFAVAGLAVAPAAAQWRALVFSETAGFRHDSIDEGQDLLSALGAEAGFATTESEDSAIFSAAGLGPFRAVIFLNTTGDVLTPAEQDALDCFLRSGGGWVGVHAAADTEHGWPGYGAILGGGAWFLSHPAIQAAKLVRESATHPSTAHLLATFTFTDEWYNFAVSPRPAVTVLLTIDESSYLPGPGAMGADHPIAWAHGIGAGRGWYTNLGHRGETYSDQAFAQHLLRGVEWAARCEPGICAGGLVFRDGFEAGGLCRWNSGS